MSKKPHGHAEYSHSDWGKLKGEALRQLHKAVRRDGKNIVRQFLKGQDRER